MYHSLYRKLYPRILVELVRGICDANRMTSCTMTICDCESARGTSPTAVRGFSGPPRRVHTSFPSPDQS